MTRTMRLRRAIALVGGLAVAVLLLWPVTVHYWHEYSNWHADNTELFHCGPAITSAFTPRSNHNLRAACQQHGRNRLLIGFIVGAATAAVAWFVPPIIFGDESIRGEYERDPLNAGDRLPRV